MTKAEYLRWALCALDLVYHGLKSAGHKDGMIQEGRNGQFLVSGSTELINLGVVRNSINAALEEGGE